MSPLQAYVFISVVVVFSVVVASDMKEKEKEIMEKCKEKTKASDSAVKKFHSLDKLDDSEEGKCFAKCSLEGYGTLNEDGTINNEPADKFIKETFGDKAEKVMEIWLSCQEKEEKEDDMCDYAYSLVQCFAENLKKEKIEFDGR